MSKESKQFANVPNDIEKKVHDLEHISNPNERRKKADALLSSIDAAFEEKSNQLNDFQNQIENLKAENADKDQTIRNINKTIEQQMEMISQDDWSTLVCLMKGELKDDWDKLDESSHNYLIMASYLYHSLNFIDADMSPAILQYGKALENELCKKIYDRYVDDLSKSSDTINYTDTGDIYKNLRNAIDTFSTEHKYYIPANNMINYFEYLAHDDDKNDFTRSFKNYLSESKVDENILSDSSFTSHAHEIISDYRNPAAHRGISMSKDAVIDCENETKKVLEKFLSAFTN